ncbi:DUF7848 domain-containing protein [Streptomyces buecherae]|uniref:DUF7848 domain-containing protein n=1 Tax=Streptomyces buecherae TaxID=2763006 RepID=UPI00164DE3F2|nr:hypothetical protein [Streptomyces buecherae]MBC3985318.1 hypothetical protein [Streptomyces buecherae]MBC3987360.1 hypothetical protein [Streptomyces buecherae]QNJ41394.1 hypothetical protein H7H31_17515 [Streptomyces buecherae]
MTYAVYRFVQHTIRQAPEGGVTFEAFCMTAGCRAESGGFEDQDDAQDWCLRHTGRNPGHDLFRRVVTDYARVLRDEE